MSRTHMVVPALAATALVAAGCGQANKSDVASQAAQGSAVATAPSTATTVAGTNPLTRAELIERADAICRRIAAKRNLLKFETSTQLALVLPKIAAYQQALFTGLNTLTPPSSMTGQWRQIVTSTQMLATSAAELSRQAQSSSGKSTSSLFDTFAQARHRLRTTARLAGIEGCATY